MANEGIIDPVVFLLKIFELELGMFVLDFQSSPWLLIGCYKQSTILPLFCPGNDQIRGHLEFGALLHVHELLMEAVAYHTSSVEWGFCGDILVPMEDLLNKVNLPFLKECDNGQAHYLAQHGDQVMVVFVEIAVEEFLGNLRSAAPFLLEPMLIYQSLVAHRVVVPCRLAFLYGGHFHLLKARNLEGLCDSLDWHIS